MISTFKKKILLKIPNFSLSWPDMVIILNLPHLPTQTSAEVTQFNKT